MLETYWPYLIAIAAFLFLVFFLIRRRSAQKSELVFYYGCSSCQQVFSRKSIRVSTCPACGQQMELIEMGIFS